MDDSWANEPSESMDPWHPIPSTESTDDQTSVPVVFSRKQLDCFEDSFSSSDRYLSLIESKLDRMRGRNCTKEPVAKDIIGGLDRIRLCHMRMLTDIDASTPYLRNSDYTDDSVSSPTVVDVLKRKIAPERQALNEEELKRLVDNDELFLNALLMDQTQAEPPVTLAHSDVFEETSISQVVTSLPVVSLNAEELKNAD